MCIRDRQEAHKHSKNVTGRTGFLWFSDDIDGQKPQGRTHYYKPDIGVTVNRLFDRQYSAADVSYKVNINVRDSKATKIDHVVNLNYRDRLWVFDTDTNLAYTFYDTKGTTEARSKEFTYNTSVSSRHTVGKVVLKPIVYLGGWTNRDELAVSTDQIYEYSAGFGLDVPDWGITSSIKAGQNRLQKSPGDDTSKMFANASIYFKPKVLDKLQGMFFLRAYVNDFRYTAVDRDFRETSVTAGLNVQM